MGHTVSSVTTQASHRVTHTRPSWTVTDTLDTAGHQGEQVAVQDGVDGLQGHKGHLHRSNKVTGVRLKPAGNWPVIYF